MTGPFEVGGRYRNYQAEYEVLEVDEEKMVVRFDDGREQRLTTAVQARIWEQVRLETPEAAPPPPPKPAKRPKTPKKTSSTTA